MLNAESTEIHHGENGGVINISELTQKLNQLVNEVNALRTAFNTHTHQGVTTGSDTTAPTVTQVTKPISQFNKKDYEDESFLH